MPKKSKRQKKAESKKIEAKEEKTELRKIATGLFIDYAKKYESKFLQLKPALVQSDIRMLLTTYISLMFLASSAAFILTFFPMLTLILLLKIDFLLSLLGALLFSATASSAVFFFLYSYPQGRASSRKAEIDANLPFAVLHMSAMAGSGMPPSAMFKAMSKYRDYGELSREFQKVARGIEVFGVDPLTAIKDVASRSPSAGLKYFLEGMYATAHTGGDIGDYLKKQADKALFDYRLKREQYNQQISVYADIYTALLVATPLLLMVILTILSYVGGTLYGMPIELLMNLGTFIVIPTLNVLFLIFLYNAQREI
ncbi:MAG TPA: type II secretion system F family protein [archaeon]|nr:type II secretion system F family protein [archaeon]